MDSSLHHDRSQMTEGSLAFGFAASIPKEPLITKRAEVGTEEQKALLYALMSMEEAARTREKPRQIQKRAKVSGEQIVCWIGWQQVHDARILNDSNEVKHH